MRLLWDRTQGLYNFTEYTMSAKELNERITDYLANGGQFNPEYMDHDKVRDLLMDVQTYLQHHHPSIDAQQLWAEYESIKQTGTL